MAIDASQLVKKARKKSGIKQGILAKKLQMTGNQLSRIENGHSNTSIEFLQKIADITGEKLIIGLTNIDLQIYDPKTK